MKIVSLRNNVAHGYTNISDQYHISEFKKYLEGSTQIESILYPMLQRLHYYQIVNTEILGELEYKFRVLDFSGSNASFLEKEVHAKFAHGGMVPQSNKLYVTSNDNKHWICLEPHWKFSFCPECKHRKVANF